MNTLTNPKGSRRTTVRPAIEIGGNDELRRMQAASDAFLANRLQLRSLRSCGPKPLTVADFNI